MFIDVSPPALQLTVRVRNTCVPVFRKVHANARADGDHSPFLERIGAWMDIKVNICFFIAPTLCWKFGVVVQHESPWLATGDSLDEGREIFKGLSRSIFMRMIFARV